MYKEQNSLSILKKLNWFKYVFHLMEFTNQEVRIYSENTEAICAPVPSTGWLEQLYGL